MVVPLDVKKWELRVDKTPEESLICSLGSAYLYRKTLRLGAMNLESEEKAGEESVFKGAFGEMICPGTCPRPESMLL